MRILLLIIGPPIIVAASYALTMLDADERTPQPLPANNAPKNAPPIRSTSSLVGLAADCRKQAATIRQQLDGNCQVIVRPPYVLAGDFNVDQLDRYHRLLVAPIAQTLSTMYFDREPAKPITILLFTGEEPFHQYARQRDQRSVVGQYGYFHRADRRIVVNAATGNGTLAHELTHALARCDFPTIPAWFDEGLAALHEQCEFSDDGSRLDGLSNWRLNVLREAIERLELGSIETLCAKRSISHAQADIDYAHARYFCLYLQSRGLLAAYYRKLRLNVETDPTGIETLKALLQTESLATTDDEFRQWVISLDPQ